MTKIYNRSSEKTKRRYLRSHMTGAEVLLWRYLKGKQLLGHKFRRQSSVGPYVLDFYCPDARPAIGLRFSDENVFSNLDGVLKCIGAAIPSRQESSITH